MVENNALNDYTGSNFVFWKSGQKSKIKKIEKLEKTVKGFVYLFFHILAFLWSFFLVCLKIACIKCYGFSERLTSVASKIDKTT